MHYFICWWYQYFTNKPKHFPIAEWSHCSFWTTK